MTQKKVLIVDDEPHMRTSLRLIVQRLGYLPFCAQNGFEALDLLAEHKINSKPFDLMLCDLQMPFLTGEELVGKMRQRKIGTPVLVITGVGDKEGVIRLMRLGCRDFIDKPFNPEEIEQHITTLLDDLSSESAETTRKEYMARLGEMARASAHDINNVIGATMGYADMALEEAGEDDVLRQRLDKIVSSARRTAFICHDLLSFDPQNSVCCKHRTDMNVLVGRVAEILRDVAAPNITVLTNERKVPLWLDADGWQMQHALLNLGFNAADAMPNGGELRYSIDEMKSEETGTPGIRITVEDTGTGIPQELLPRIFDDGFSTKSKGHGIGLANIRRIVENHDGTINVGSFAGKGTCFTLFLPFSKR